MVDDPRYDGEDMGTRRNKAGCVEGKVCDCGVVVVSHPEVGSGWGLPNGPSVVVKPEMNPDPVHFKLVKDWSELGPAWEQGRCSSGDNCRPEDRRSVGGAWIEDGSPEILRIS